jgi:hypothetical protein
MAGHNIGDQVWRIGAQMWHATKYETANNDSYQENAGKYSKMNRPVHINRVMRAHPEHNAEEEIMEDCEKWITRGDEVWKICCPGRLVLQPLRKKTPRVQLTNQRSPPLPLEIILPEQKDCPTIIVQQRYKNGEIQIQKPKQTKENHNDCFIEAHNKELEEQRSAMENTILIIRKERNTIVE